MPDRSDFRAVLAPRGANSAPGHIELDVINTVNNSVEIRFDPARGAVVVRPAACSHHSRRPGNAVSAQFERGCPLNHRATHRSYPQLWRSQRPSAQNRQLWPSNPAWGYELQRCKLPTVWITPVDNFPARAPGCPSLRRRTVAVAAAHQARRDGLAVEKGTMLWETLSCLEVTGRYGLSEDARDPAAYRLGRPGQARPDVTRRAASTRS